MDQFLPILNLNAIYSVCYPLVKFLSYLGFGKIKQLRAYEYELT